MRKILDRCPPPPEATGSFAGARHAAPERARQLHETLAAFLRAAAAGTLPVHVPELPDGAAARGAGHFHLAAELFLQVDGWTRFCFPHGELHLAAGEAAVLPPRLLHDEDVGRAADGAPFSNVVIYAEGPALTCHLAHEAEAGRPGILHLEASQHPQAARIQQWLGDAALLGRPAGATGSDPAAPDAWAATQARALVAAATSGVLRVLGDADPQVPPEPTLVARTRVLVNNQLGDPALSVRRLAEQAGCTADYLSHVFRQTTGEALAAFIVRQRMERAAHLLSQSALAGKEVAWACGFATQSYFVRSFREHHGLTPQAWRARQALTAP